MKIKKFNTNEVYYKIFRSTNENREPEETIHQYKTYESAIEECVELLENGFESIGGTRYKVYDAYIIKVTKERVGDEDIKMKLNLKKYNI